MAVLAAAAIAACTPNLYEVSVTVTGLAGSGLVLQNNAADDLPVSADGTVTFATSLASGSAYAVSIQTQPTNPTQTCTVGGGTGTVGAGDVTTVVVDCATDRFIVGGLVQGLVGTLVLRNNGGDDITVSANGAFAFPTTVASNSAYAVTVLSQPESPSQTCVVTDGAGTVADADVSSVRVNCNPNAFTVGGTVTGLAGSGLVLQNSAGDDLAIAVDGSFTFPTPVTSGTTYDVTVAAQPADPTQVCTVSAGAGTIAGANVTDVAVTCTTSRFTIGGTVAGLVGTGLVLRNNGGGDLAVSADGTFTFAAPVASAQPYAVTVLTQPGSPSQTCTVADGSGTVTASNVTSVSVTCATNTFTVGGTLSGLASGATVVLRNNNADDLPLSANGSFTFPVGITSGQPYAITVSVNPSSPDQLCAVSNGSGTVEAENVTTVVVTCAGVLTRWSDGTTAWPDQACNSTNSFGNCDTNSQAHANAWATYVCVQNGYSSGVWTGNKLAGCSGDVSMYCEGQIPCSPAYESTCMAGDQTRVEITCFE